MKITGDLVIFITGAGSGLGEAAALYFLFKGCKVALVGNNEDHLKRV
jgi:NADP-dependent 3-hydroxy acid dehydrogenase YdfG